MLRGASSNSSLADLFELYMKAGDAATHSDITQTQAEDEARFAELKSFLGSTVFDFAEGELDFAEGEGDEIPAMIADGGDPDLDDMIIPPMADLDVEEDRMSFFFRSD